MSYTRLHRYSIFGSLLSLSLSLLLPLRLSSSRPPSRFLPQLKYGHAIRALARGRKNDRVSLSFSRFLSRNCQAERERERESTASSLVFTVSLNPVHFSAMPVCPCTSFSRFLHLSPHSSSPSSFRPLLQLPCLAFPPLSLFAKRVSFRRLSVSTSSSHSILLCLFLPVVLHPLTRLFLEPLALSPSLPPSSRLSVSPCSVFFLSVVTFFAYPTERYR